MSRRLILASRSPQRKAILEQLGVTFEVRPSDAVEVDEGPPAAVAHENALRKAMAIEAPGDATVLAVDTLVATELTIWGKPPTEEAAKETLRRLQGREHVVFSGYAVLCEGVIEHAGTAATKVRFRPLDDERIDRYVATGEWRERAGAYAIQGRGAALVQRIEGDYLNVVGLPVAALLDVWPELLAERAAA